jgi:hypothetical protein
LAIDLHHMKIRKAADAMVDGQLLATEETLDVRLSVPAMLEARRKQDMTHAAAHRRVVHRLSGVRAPVCAPAAHLGNRSWCEWYKLEAVVRYGGK